MYTSVILDVLISEAPRVKINCKDFGRWKPALHLFLWRETQFGSVGESHSARHEIGADHAVGIRGDRTGQIPHHARGEAVVRGVLCRPFHTKVPRQPADED